MCSTSAASTACSAWLLSLAEALHNFLQIRDLNAGTFGFVELALDKSTGQQVAIKFIERGDKVYHNMC